MSHWTLFNSLDMKSRGNK